MSILYFEGFDHYGPSLASANQGPYVRREIWYDNDPAASLLEDTISYQARNSGNAIAFNCTATGAQEYFNIFIRSETFTPTTNIVVGEAFNFEQIGDTDLNGDADPYLLMIWAGGVRKIEVSATYDTVNDYTLNISAMGSDYVISGIPQNEWQYLGLQIDSVAPGRVRVWLNGQLEFDEVPAAPTSDAYDQVSIHATKGFYHGPLWHDDLMILDGNDASDGAAWQTFPGPIKIVPTVVTANGDVNDMAAVGAATAWQTVDESPGANDGDATHVYAENSGATQSFRVTTDGGTDAILAVTTLGVTRQSDPSAGISKMVWYANDGTLQTEDDAIVLQPVYRMLDNNYKTMPDGTGFTTAKIEAAQWGVRFEEDL